MTGTAGGWRRFAARRNTDCCAQAGANKVSAARDTSHRTLAEAAAWLARLCADDMRAADEIRFRKWLAKSPSCGAAFAAVAEVWNIAGAVQPLCGRCGRVDHSHLTMRHQAAECQPSDP